MGGNEYNSTTLRLIENLRHEVKRGKKDCQSEAIDLFKQIFTAIDTHTDTPSVNKGLDDLAQRVCALEAKLSTVTKERDDLLDKVDSLRGVIGQMSAKLLPTMQPIQLPRVENANSFDDGNVNSGGQIGVTIPRIRRGQWETTTHTTTQIVRKQVRHSLKEPYDYSDGHALNEMPYADTKHVASNGEAPPLTKALTQAQIREGYGHWTNNDNPDAAQQFALNTPTTNKKMDKKFKCEQCSYSSVHQYQMKGHVEAVHDKIKRFRCEECGYASARKDGLERHWDASHNKGDKKYKCGRCPYSSAANAKLKTHMERKHGGMTGTLHVKGEEDVITH